MENKIITSSKNELENTDDTGMPMWIQVLSLISSIISITYCIKTRSLEDFIKYGSYIIFGIFIVIVLILIIGTIRNGFIKPTWKGIFLGVPTIVVLLIFMGISNYAFFVVIKDIFLWLKSPSISKTSAVILTALLTLGVGSILFYFRLRMRAIYGLTEAAIGIVVAGNRAITQIDQFTSSDFYLAILTASVYLIVRGFDNIHQGLTKEPIDQYGTKLFTFLKMRI